MLEEPKLTEMGASQTGQIPRFTSPKKDEVIGVALRSTEVVNVSKSHFGGLSCFISKRLTSFDLACPEGSGYRRAATESLKGQVVTGWMVAALYR
jgi:hypothetical protein